VLSYELEENIHSYMIYLLSAKEADFKALNKRKKVWQVMGVLFLTQATQSYALTIMVMDVYYQNHVKEDTVLVYYINDRVGYLILRWLLLAFSWVLFMHEMNEGLGQIFIFWRGDVVKRKRICCLNYWLFFISLLFKCLLCIYTLCIVIMIIFSTHMGRERGIGLILNYTAAVIIVDFDNLASKIYVRLWDSSIYDKFLVVEVKKKVFTYKRCGWFSW